MKNLILIKIFSWFWKKRLYHNFTGKQYKVIEVTGWRSCLVDGPCGERIRMWFVFKHWDY